MKKILIAGSELESIAQSLKQAGHTIEIAESGMDVGRALAEADAVIISPMAPDVRLAAIVRRRLRIASSHGREQLRVGFAFNVKRAEGVDAEAEFDALGTIAAIGQAIASHGYELIELEASSDFPALIEAAEPDFVFNIAEGWHGRSRESQIPSLLEFRAVPFAGSDSVAISITLDKVLAKKIVAQAGLETPRFQTFSSGREKPRADLRYPLIVKPAAEGSSKGIKGHAVVHDAAQLQARVRECVEDYRQHALVEEYIVGREFTVGLIGNGRPVVLPVLEVQFTNEAGEFPVYSYEIKQEIIDGARYVCPAPIDAALQKRLEKRAREIFAALELRDVARIDFRVSDEGAIHFLEVNPLPGLTPGFSDMCVIAAAAGLSYEELIGYILKAGMKRCGIARKHLPALEPLQDRVLKRHREQEA
ncbi:MAG: ATP-grasp domain-containing protein [Bradymonadaceae bacterium]|nr:ATP-grasp domain-containing protein [Lujinxingiaceae bacterium]